MMTIIMMMANTEDVEDKDGEGEDDEDDEGG